MPKVWNKRDKNVPEDAIYVGRPSKWGNPYVIGQDGTREEIVEKYRKHLIHLMLKDEKFWDWLEPLKGKDLVCWCAPKKCHADLLMYWANRRFADSSGCETILCYRDCPLCIHDDKCSCSGCIKQNYDSKA